MKLAKSEFDRDCEDVGYKKRISGKQFIIDLNNDLQGKYGFNISNAAILDEFHENDVDPEMRAIVKMVNETLS